MKSIAMLLAGCAGQPPVHGNAKGGVMQWFGMNAQQTHARRQALRQVQQAGPDH